MEAKAMAKSIRVSSRKARLVVDLIRGKKVGEAVAILNNTKSTATESILSMLKCFLTPVNAFTVFETSLICWGVVPQHPPTPLIPNLI